MRFPRLACLLIPCLLQGAGAPPIPNVTRAINGSTPLSQRVVAYDIQARYDPRSHTLDGVENLTYLNTTGVPLDRFPFHLYLNGFQPHATWVREAHSAGNRDTHEKEWETRQYGADQIRSLEVEGMGDLTARLEYLQPEDGNPEDRSVVQVRLPKPLAPGASIRFKIGFHDQFPETQARTGWKRDFVLGGQWFPKVGVFWHGQWNCHQFHSDTEFFADFGVYDVKLTLPRNQVVGASGVEEATVQNDDGTKTVSFHGEDIHDFAWTACPRFRVFEDTYSSGLGPVKLRLLMLPGHWDQARRHATILKQTLDRFERWYGPYPYKTLTLVDPEPDSAAGGMEYPTFITAGTTWWMPEGLRIPELVTEHEFGHQYWYGMVATNEFEEAWLDEGINSYTEVKVLEDLFGRDGSAIRQWGAHLGDRGMQRLSYLQFADMDPIVRKGWLFRSYGSYGGITYGKTASTLLTLESIVGEETLRKAIHTWFMQRRFTHPTGTDFLRTVEEVSGQDLKWFFDQAVTGTRILDYEVLSVDSERADWPAKTKPGKDTLYQSTVVIHRKGDFILPVEVAIRFDDGQTVRERWNGEDRWISYVYQRHAKVTTVEVDPEHRVLLARNTFNTSWSQAGQGGAVRKIANLWSFATQLFAQALAWWLI
jgi:hypothetical protein